MKKKENIMPSNWLNFTKIREQLNFSEVLSHYGFSFKMDGKGQCKIACPFHEDKTPSCSINENKNAFKCFGCPEKGNILEFVGKMEGFDTDNSTELRKAAQFCVDTFDLDPGIRTSDKKESSSGRIRAKSKPAPVKVVKQEKHKNFTIDESDKKKTQTDATFKNDNQTNEPLTFRLDLQDEHPFIQKRGIDKKTAAKFGIGFYDGKGLMKGRVCFPIKNDVGDLVAYAGRWADDKLPEDIPRYLLPAGFQKQKVLYNFDRLLSAQDNGYSFDTIVIVEGYWSVIKLHQSGVPVVATLGTSISEDQVGLLKKLGIVSIIILYDGDDGGRAGAKDVASKLSQNFWIKIINLPDGISPDEMDASEIKKLPLYLKN